MDLQHQMNWRMNLPKKNRTGLKVLIIVLIIAIAIATVILTTPQTAFGSNPRIVYQFNTLGMLNLTGINLDNVDEGKITLKGCETNTMQTPIQPIPASVKIHKTEIASHLASVGRCKAITPVGCEAIILKYSV